ncbi:MAG: DMT family transporter [Deltaproteobacteria bacterium]|nr:DMT family transporter [Deltaproteobacteria bacterium]
MGAEFFALTAALGWAIEAILVRKGAQYASVSLAALMSFAVTALLLWAVNWWSFPLSLLYSPATFYFILGGLIQPAFVRFLHYTGIVRLGASRAGPVRGIAPLFAIIVAFFFLGERPGVSVYLGAVLCVAGLWLISSRRQGETDWKTIDLLFPLGAALLTAVSQNIRKTGLLILPNPYIAAAVTTTTSLLVFLLSLLVTRQIRSIRMDRRCLPSYGSAAVISTVAQVLTFMSLSMGQVSVVVPLVNTNPLFIVILSALFLKDLEKVTGLVVTGAILIVGGVALITYH